ncbi:MAG TPA: hypothetical protein VFC15_02895 [Candidatus Limnocylindrales bacterium]|nr:hypothetical protein [Candidatus Limnocylindrales bacterium]
MFTWQGSEGIHASVLPQLISGFLGALIGAAVTVGGIVYNQRRGTEALRRWLTEAHFDLLQDVADCAGEYERMGNFGIFRKRLSPQVRQLRDGLYRDSTGGLEKEEYRRVYRSLSDVDYMIFVHDRNFAPNLMVSYINECINQMREAQELFGSFPKARPNAETDIMAGKQITYELPERGAERSFPPEPLDRC